MDSSKYNEWGKFKLEERTFETRVEFIRSIFANKNSQEAIMAHCIKYKLDKSLQAYIKNLEKSEWTLRGEDPIKVLKRIDNK